MFLSKNINDVNDRIWRNLSLMDQTSLRHISSPTSVTNIGVANDCDKMSILGRLIVDFLGNNLVIKVLKNPNALNVSSLIYSYDSKCLNKIKYRE